MKKNIVLLGNILSSCVVSVVEDMKNEDTINPRVGVSINEVKLLYRNFKKSPQIFEHSKSKFIDKPFKNYRK